VAVDFLGTEAVPAFRGRVTVSIFEHRQPFGMGLSPGQPAANGTSSKSPITDRLP
jgi:hypothetical protein